MLAAADEACEGLGIPGSLNNDSPGAFELLAEISLVSDGTLAQNLELQHVAVLPKQRTPDCGMTLRSLTHHLALHSGREVSPRWIQPPLSAYENRSSFNVLLAPWPLEIESSQFCAITTDEVLADGFRLCSIWPEGAVRTTAEEMAKRGAIGKRRESVSGLIS